MKITRNKIMTFRITESLKAKLTQQARAKKISVADLITSKIAE